MKLVFSCLICVSLTVLPWLRAASVSRYLIWSLMLVLSTCVCVTMLSRALEEPALSALDIDCWCSVAIWPTCVVRVRMSAFTASTRERKSGFERVLRDGCTYSTWP